MDNDGDGLYDLNDDNCQTAVPDINLNPAALNFGSLLIGNSATLATQIENLGNANLVVANVVAGTGTSAEFSFSAPGTPFTVPAGGSQSISVTYQPVDTGTDTGCLSILSDDPDESTVEIALQTTGTIYKSSILNFLPSILNAAGQQNR